MSEIPGLDFRVDSTLTRLRGDLILESVVGEEMMEHEAGTTATIRAGYGADAAIVTEPTAVSGPPALAPCSGGGTIFEVTIEGLPGPEEHPVQKAWIAEQVPQCGYCQPGQILTATALLESGDELDDEAIDRAMDQVLCRCGTYQRIRRAIRRAAEEVRRG